MIARAAAALAVVAAAAPAAAQSVRLVIEGPADAVGDGATAVGLRVRVDPPEAVTELRDVRLRTTAGALGEPRPDGADAIAVELTPPRLAVDGTAVVEIEAVAGRRRVTARHAIAVRAPAPELGAASTGGPFDLTAPRTARAGGRDAVTVSIRAPTTGSPPRAAVSAGRLSAWRVDGDRLVADLRLPPELYPQAVVVAVASPDGATVDWTAIELHAIATVALRSEPHASVAVEVGGATFGPVAVDRRGRGELAIVAPPGVDEATAVATDELGNVTRRALSLGAPPFRRAVVLCPDASATAIAVVVDRTGAPDRGAALNATAQPGAVDGVRPRAPGVYELLYDAPAEARIGDELELSVGLAGDPGPPAACRAAIPGEPPAIVELALGAPAYRAGSGAVIEVTVDTRYTGRLPPLIAPIALETELGELSEPARAADGRYTATWRVPNAFGGRATARVRARAGDATSAWSELALQPGPAVAVEVSASAPAVRADGRTIVTVTARVVDAHGNPVTDAALTVRARGQLTPFVARDGVYAARYTAPVAHDDGVDRIAVTAGSAPPAELAVHLIGVRKRVAITGRAGYLSNTGKVGGPIVAVDAAWRPFPRVDAVAIGIELGAYRSAHTAMAVTTEVTAVPALARVTAALGLGPVTAYAGGAAGAVWSNVLVSSDDAGEVGAGGWSLAVGGLAGAELPAGPGLAVGELGFLRASLDDDAASGNVAGFHATIGYRLEM